MRLSRLIYYSTLRVVVGKSYVGMTTVRREEQLKKANSDITTKEVGRNRLLRATSAAQVDNIVANTDM